MLKIKKPFTDEIIEIALHDIQTKMNWNDGILACNELGDGWRLPDKEEFELIYNELYNEGLGNFRPEIYWTCEELFDEAASNFHFDKGKSYSYFKTVEYNIRPVRTLSS